MNGAREEFLDSAWSSLSFVRVHEHSSLLFTSEINHGIHHVWLTGKIPGSVLTDRWFASYVTEISIYF